MLRKLYTRHLLRNGKSTKNWNLILNAIRTIADKGGKSCIPPSTPQDNCPPPCHSHPPKAFPLCSPPPKCPKHSMVPKKCIIPSQCLPGRCPQPFTPSKYILWSTIVTSRLFVIQKYSSLQLQARSFLSYAYLSKAFTSTVKCMPLLLCYFFINGNSSASSL